MTPLHYAGTALVLLLICAVGLWSGRRAKRAGDFATGGHSAGPGLVAGAIMGTLIGGSSTIGTAQLAYSYGFSAWWFTLGGGIGCIVLAVLFSKPLYQSEVRTLPQLFRREYGHGCGTAATVLTSIGSFLSIVAQLLSGVTLVMSVSSLGSLPTTAVIVALMIVYVVFGGMLSAGMVGIAKMALLFLSVGTCGILAYIQGGGLAGFRAVLPAGQYFSLFARGAAVDAGAGLSLVLGILTTQTYIQAILSARTLRVSRQGAVLSAVLMPLIGLAGIFVGLFMRVNYPDIPSATALPRFLMEYLPPVAGGMTLATLLVALVGTGAGVALGLGTMISHDIYKVYFRRDADGKAMLRVTRLSILLILLATALFTFGNLGSLILNWSFLSMGLRGSVAFWPLCFALFCPGRVPPRYALAAMLSGPVFVFLGKAVLPAGIDPLFLGLLASGVPMLAGYWRERKNI